MLKAYLVLQNGKVINRIVSGDPDESVEHIRQSYQDPSYKIMAFDNIEDPFFLNANNTVESEKDFLTPEEVAALTPDEANELKEEPNV